MNYHFIGEDAIPSPALIYYRDLIEANTRLTVRMAGDPERLWPHIKTHKMAQMLKMQLSMGIHRFKCATYQELRLACESGATDCLWAYPVVGPNVERFLSLMEEFPRVHLYALADDLDACALLGQAALARKRTASVLVDVNMGMNRTGIAPERLYDAYRALSALPGVSVRGMHCYDGHIHDHDLNERLAHADSCAQPVYAVRDALIRDGLDVDIMIMGGTPTFPCHARHPGVFLSPGTLFVSDAGYAAAFPDIPVVPAAAVLTRVISHPADGLFTLDTGYKAVSADPVDARGQLAGYEALCDDVLSSEEHWVFRMRPGHEHKRPSIGSVLYVIPTHICPTTCLYDAAYVVSDGRLCDLWPVAARDRVHMQPDREALS